jgi:hypothetical protein
MKTFAEVTSEVLRYGFNDGPQVNKARIEEWIDEAQLQVARHTGAPEFQETSETALVVGQYKYSLPAGIVQMQSIVYPAAERRLKPVDLQTFDSYVASEIESPPLIYAIYKDELWLWPIPSVADKLLERYIKKPGRGTITLAEDYLHLLVDYAVSRAYRAEDDMEAATAHQQQYERDLKQYRADMLRQQDDRPKQLQGTWS